MRAHSGSPSSGIIHELCCESSRIGSLSANWPSQKVDSYIHKKYATLMAKVVKLTYSNTSTCPCELFLPSGLSLLYELSQRQLQPYHTQFSVSTIDGHTYIYMSEHSEVITGCEQLQIALNDYCKPQTYRVQRCNKHQRL